MKKSTIAAGLAALALTLAACDGSTSSTASADAADSKNCYSGICKALHRFFSI